MELHHSNNPNLYLRQSYLSQSGLPRPNLQSRVVFREEEKSGRRWLLGILTVLGLLAATWLLWGPSVHRRADGTCQADDGVVGWLKEKVLGWKHAGPCQVKEEVTSAEDPSKTVTTVRQTRSCPIDGAGEGSWWSRWFGWGQGDCHKYAEHERQLARLTPTIKPFAKAPPSLRDIQTFPSRYAHVRKLVNDTSNSTLRSDVQFLFDEISRDRNWAAAVHTREITHPDFVAAIADTDFIHRVQLPAKDLQLSQRVLTEKDATVDRLRDEFHGKNSEQNCTAGMAELQKALRIHHEKKDYSTGRVADLTRQLRDAQGSIEASLRRKFADENGPVAEINRLDNEIHGLQASIQRLEARIGLLDGTRLPDARRRVSELEDKVRKNKEEIAAITDRQSHAAADTAKAKARLDESVMVLGTLKYRLSVQLRNAEIKEFLSSLLKKEGSEKSLEQLFAETEADKKEIIKIVRAVVQRTSGFEALDVNLTEEEWTQAIERDREEFQEIMKIYHDLKDIIRRYREVDINIVALRTDIRDKEAARAAAEAEWKGLQVKDRLDHDRLAVLREDNAKLQVEIKQLDDGREGLERELAADRAELRQVRDDLAKRRARKAELEAKHRVG